MRRHRRAVVVAPALAGGIVAALALVACGLALAQTAGRTGAGAEAGGGAIEATTSLTPRVPMFGDTVRAAVDVELDPARVDEGTVAVATDFAPWAVVGRPERSRHAVDGRTYLRTVFTIRCTTGPCLPSGATTASTLTPARISYEALDADGGRSARRTITASWPLLVVYSRFAALQLDPSAAEAAQADLVTLPKVSYSFPPGALAAAFGALAALLAAAGGLLLYAALPRRAPVEPLELEPEPQPSLTPLEQALALLEESARVEGASEQRRALELVAEELEEWGDDELSAAAKVLAWSAGTPRVEQTAALAARVRAELEQELLARAELERNGGGDAG